MNTKEKRSIKPEKRKWRLLNFYCGHSKPSFAQVQVPQRMDYIKAELIY